MRNIRVNRQLMQAAKTTQTMALRGSATTLPNNVLVPLPSISMSLVNRAINSGVPSSVK